MSPSLKFSKTTQTTVTASAAPGTVILKENPRRTGFGVSFPIGANCQLVASSQDEGGGLAFYQNQQQAAAAMIDNYRFFDIDTYGQLVKGTIRCISSSGNSLVLVMEVYTVGDCPCKDK